MPPQIGSAISGIESLGSSIGTGAQNLYANLPNLFSAPPTTTGLDPGTGYVSGGPGGTIFETTPGTPATGTPASTTAIPSPTAPVAAPAAAPAAPGASPATELGGFAKMIGNAIELIQRYQLQQNLQDPSWVAGQIGKLETPLSGSLKNAVGKQVQAQAQEAGLGGAPGLFRSALAQALAPYQFQEQQDAEQAFFNSIGASEGAYPLGGGLGDFGQYATEAFPQATA